MLAASLSIIYGKHRKNSKGSEILAFLLYVSVQSLCIYSHHPSLNPRLLGVSPAEDIVRLACGNGSRKVTCDGGTVQAMND